MRNSETTEKTESETITRGPCDHPSNLDGTRETTIEGHGGVVTGHGSTQEQADKNARDILEEFIGFGWAER